MEHLEGHTTAISYEKSYMCCNCGKTFAYFKRYTSHMEVCTSDSGELPIQKVKEAIKKPKTVLVPVKLPVTNHLDDKDQEWHECPICNKKFTSKFEVNRHSTSHSLDKPYECIECGRRFSKKDYLIKHIPIHSEGKSFSCHLCSYQVSRSDRFKIHMHSHGINNPFKCSLCGQGFTGLKDLNKHLNSHNSSALDPGANTSSYQRIGLCVFNCVECGLKFEKAEKYKQHMLKEHDVEEPYECSICGDNFASKLQLNKHLNNHNTIVLKTGADIPNITPNHSKGKKANTSTKEVKLSSVCNGYKEHLDSQCTDNTIIGVESNEFVVNSRYQSSPFETEACVSVVTSAILEAKSQLKKMYGPKSKRTDGDIHCNSECKSYFCNDCNLQLSGKLDYKLHMKSHPKKFPCFKCGKSYTRKNNLKRHPCPATRGKISTPKSGSYKCKTCDISFSSGKELDEHIIYHVSDIKDSDDVKRVITSIKKENFPGTREDNPKTTSDANVGKHSSNFDGRIAHNSALGNSMAAENYHGKNSFKQKKRMDLNDMSFSPSLKMFSSDPEQRKKKAKHKHVFSCASKSVDFGSSLPRKKVKSKSKCSSQVTGTNIQCELIPKKKSKLKSSLDIIDMIENEWSNVQTNLSIPTIHKREHDRSVLEYEKLVVYEFMSTMPVLPDMKKHSSCDGLWDMKITDELCMKFFV